MNAELSHVVEVIFRCNKNIVKQWFAKTIFPFLLFYKGSQWSRNLKKKKIWDPRIFSVRVYMKRKKLKSFLDWLSREKIHEHPQQKSWK